MKKIIFLILAIAIGGASAYGYLKYRQLFEPNVPSKLENAFLLIPTGSTYKELVDNLYDSKFILDSAAFQVTADFMKFNKDSKVKAGRYKIEPNWSNRKLIQKLRSGEQSSVKVVISSGRMVHEIIGKINGVIEADPMQLMDLLSDPAFLEENGYTSENLMSLFIPNTYNMFWNTNPKGFFNRLKKEKMNFWKSKNRLDKAKALDLTPEEVYTLASIVEKETNYKPERPKIAGVYLNRLKKGILLQADPTVVFATGDFTARRVLNKHLEVDSPYNTYKNLGLPPGPIGLASISSIDAVLNADEHNYIFFCAKPDNSGQHAFAKTLSGHNVNANKFRSWLNKRRVMH